MASSLCGGSSVLFAALVLVCLQLGVTTAEKECQNKGTTILCYACDSYVDPRCVRINDSDPVNLQPPIKPCHGCCVKIIEHAGSPSERIRRMCTEQLVINYFIVDYVCLREGNKRKGQTCFCEENLCNSAPAATFGRPASPLVAIACLALLFTALRNNLFLLSAT